MEHTTPQPPKPPPLPVVKTASVVSRHQSSEIPATSSSQPFSIAGTIPADSIFQFPKPSNDRGTISLGTIVSHYLGTPSQRHVPAHLLYLNLGRLRCLLHTVKQYNQGIRAPTPLFLQYWRPRTLHSLSGFGFGLAANDEQPVVITGLAELIHAIEELYKDDITESCQLIQSGFINFNGLGELYHPENPVGAQTCIGGELSAFMVTDYFFEEHRTSLGKQRSFHLHMEYIATMGAHFSIVKFADVLSSWTGVQARSLSSLTYIPLDTVQSKTLYERGQRYVEFGAGSSNFLAYSAQSFFLQTPAAQRDGTKSGLAKSRSNRLHKGGRAMIDTDRGLLLGYHASTGFDEPTLALSKSVDLYRQWRNLHGSTATRPDSLIVWETVPPELCLYCWPALIAFSFTAKAWGHVLVSGLEPIQFYDDAFDRLVMSEERKKLIRALVRFGPDAEFEDLVGGKAGGSVFLLHGPPGVGKTLTAEAIAEMLHRPLYSITMGELGTSAESLENRLGDVLDLCAEWNAIALLDEADVFLEKRNTLDLVQHSMVCVMLRMLEYHSGILFLTTNHVRQFDPAIETRVTVALYYPALALDARVQIWNALLERTTVTVDADVDSRVLGKHVLNGREIKNIVRLAVALTREEKLPTLSSKTLELALQTTSIGKRVLNDCL